MICSIPRLLSCLLVISVVTSLTYGAGAAPVDHAPDASASQAKATLARKLAGGARILVRSKNGWAQDRDWRAFLVSQDDHCRKMYSAPLEGGRLPTSRAGFGHTCESTIVVISDMAASSIYRRGAAGKIGLIHHGTAPVKTVVVSVPPGAGKLRIVCNLMNRRTVHIGRFCPAVRCPHGSRSARARCPGESWVGSRDVRSHTANGAPSKVEYSGGITLHLGLIGGAPSQNKC